jgi:hypothetical protein
MGPAEYFEQHRVQYWLALAGPFLTTAYALAKRRGAANRRQARLYGALAALTAAQAVGLLRIRPGRQRAGGGEGR